jgi:hypothetical protein
MDSEADSSVLAPSTTQDSIQTGSRQTRGQSAYTTWAHSRAAYDGEDPTLRYCKHCTDEPIYSTTVTTNLRKHLKSKHEITVEVAPSPIQAAIIQQLQQLYIRAASSGQTEEINTQVFRKHLNQDTIYKALVSLIVVRNLSFRMVEWPEFYTLCQVLNLELYDFITTAHSQIVKKIDQCWQTHKDIVRKKLQSAISSIHLLLDIWTSPNSLLLLGICAHFVDCSQEKLSKALLALCTVANHSRDKQFTSLYPVLKDYSIVEKLGAVVGDNATTNNTLCCTIEACFSKEEDVK